MIALAGCGSGGSAGPAEGTASAKAAQKKAMEPAAKKSTVTDAQKIANAETARLPAKTVGSMVIPRGGTGQADVLAEATVKSHFAVRPPVAQQAAATSARTYPRNRGVPTRRSSLESTMTDSSCDTVPERGRSRLTLVPDTPRGYHRENDSE